MDYIDAIKRPFSDWKKLLIGCVLNIIPIVNLFSMGYALQASKLTLNKKKNLPEWTNWKDLFVNGFLLFVISMIYMIPAMIALVFALGSGLSVGLLTEDPFSGILAAGPILVVALVLMIIFGYFSPLAAVNFAKTNKFSSAFDFKLILKKTLTKTYFVAWIVAVLLGIGITLILSLIPFVGGRISSFVTLLVALTIYAQAYNEIK